MLLRLCSHFIHPRQLLLLPLLLMLAGAALAQPVITSVAPGAAPAGTTVTINGINFDPSPGGNHVYFGAVKAAITSATTTILTVTVPKGATYSPISVTTNLRTTYSNQPFIVMGNTGCGSTGFDFPQNVTYNATSYPRHVSTGDIDGDGKPDMVVVNNDAASFSIFRNTSVPGAVSMAPKLDFATATAPFCTALADIDGDGRLDVIVANYGSSNIMVYQNASGPGIISLNVPISLATQNPISIAIADFDKDGRPDIATANQNSHTVSVFRNLGNGTISFGPKLDFPAGDRPQGLVAGDLNGDEYPDLALVNSEVNTVTLLRNVSNPGLVSFASTISYPAESKPFSVAMGDLDGDNKPELTVTNSGSHSISIFRNTSFPGNIVLAAPVNLASGIIPLWVSIADLNGNGKPDLSVVNFNSNSISLFNNNSTTGNLNFAAPAGISTGVFPRCVAITDVDGDDRLDLGIAESVANTFSIKWNASPSAMLLTATPQPTACGQQNGSIVATASNGQAPYTYSINGINFQSSGTFTGLITGNYIITAKDATGCIKTTSVLIVNTSGPQLHLSPGSSSCSNQTTINASATGGTPPYRYSLDGTNFQPSGIFNNLAPGAGYSVEVRDANNCPATGGIFLWAFDLDVNAIATHAICGNSNGGITASPTGGSAPYTYSLDGINYQTGNNFTGLTPGNYLLRVKDVNGCIEDSAIVINTGCLTITPFATGTSCAGDNGSIVLTVSNGQAPYTYSKDGVNFQSSNSFTGLAAGDYTITVKDAAGATSSIQVNISSSTALQVAATSTPATCTNNNGTLAVTSPIANTTHYSIDGVNYQLSNTFNGLSARNYTVYAKDGAGCIGTASVQVGLTNDLLVNPGSDITICEGTKGLLAAQANGASFSWTPSSGLSNAAVLQPQASPVTTTTYTLTTTLGACTAAASVTVFVDPAPVANAGKDTSFCLGKSVQLQGSGGTSFTWSPAPNLDNPFSARPWLNNPPAGKMYYTLHVKDSKGCSSLKPDSVLVNVVKVAVSLGNDTMTAINQPLQLNARDVNSSGFISYSWSPATGLDNATIANPVATLAREITYRVTVSTADGCQGTDDIHIRVFKGPDIYVPNAFTPDGNRLNDVLKPIPVGIKTFRHFTIYNRWGQRIFSTSSADKGWDGLLNGQMQTGSFVWVAEGEDFNGVKIIRKGSVIVLR